MPVTARKKRNLHIENVRLEAYSDELSARIARLTTAMDKAPKAKVAKAGRTKAAKTPPSVQTSFESPESSSIQAAHYDPTTQVLKVEFKPEKNRVQARSYTFPGVPVETWQQFVESDSKGTFFARDIRPKYAGKLA